MGFKKYQHIERFGTKEVEGIELGECFVFPKIDGTNGSIWLEGDTLHCGSRNREISLDNDNAGFAKYVHDNADKYLKYFKAFPDRRLFGEWLVPHSLKTYRESAWRRFYVFDVAVDVLDGFEYLPYLSYIDSLTDHNIDFIPCTSTIKSGSYEHFLKEAQKNTFLIDDGNGAGEGVVIKNYGYHNQYGRQTWAKVVLNEFKEANTKAFGHNEVSGGKMVEDEAVERFCTEAFIRKTYEKISVAEGGWSSRLIPRLLETVYHDFVVEESYNMVKYFKRPTINFRTLQHFITTKIKSTLTEVF